METTYYRAWMGRSQPVDDRHNPKIELRNTQTSSIFTTTFNRQWFMKGYDQTVEGTWGFVEEDGSCPSPIKQACLILVMTYATDFYEKYGQSIGASGGAVGPLRREKTDDHEREWHGPNYSTESAYTMDFSIPNEVYGLIRNYIAPRGIAVTAARWVESIPSLSVEENI